MSATVTLTLPPIKPDPTPQGPDSAAAPKKGLPAPASQEKELRDCDGFLMERSARTNRSARARFQIKSSHPTKLPVAVRFYLYGEKPPREKGDLWIAQSDFRLNSEFTPTQRAYAVADLISNSKHLGDKHTAYRGDEDTALAYQDWLNNKVSFITSVKEEHLAIFWRAHNRCAIAQGKLNLSFDEYVQAHGFVKQDDGSWQNMKIKPRRTKEEQKSTAKV